MWHLWVVCQGLPFEYPAWLYTDCTCSLEITLTWRTYFTRSCTGTIRITPPMQSPHPGSSQKSQLSYIPRLPALLLWSTDAACCCQGHSGGCWGLAAHRWLLKCWCSSPECHRPCGSWELFWDSRHGWRNPTQSQICGGLHLQGPGGYDTSPLARMQVWLQVHVLQHVATAMRKQVLEHALQCMYIYL